MLNLCLLSAVTAFEAQMLASDTKPPKTDTSVLLGRGLCRSSSGSEIQSATGGHAKEYLTNATCAQDCLSSIIPCTGYAIGPDHCVIYFKQPLQAVRPNSLQQRNSFCYASSPRYSADWPIRSIAREDFLQCFNMVKDDGSNIRASEYKKYMREEVWGNGFSTAACSRRCQLYSHFGLKKHDEHKKCFCMDRFDYAVEPPVDRFTTGAFGQNENLNHCPPVDCDYSNAGCNWGKDTHIAIYRTPVPNDGDECPDSHWSHEHESRFMYIRGTNELDLNKHGAYSHRRVDSPRKCAELCYEEGPYFRGGNKTAYNEVCHAYFSHREREQVELVNFDCYLFNEPILSYRTHKKFSTSHADNARKMSHVCALRTCIEDTPCEFGYQRQSGFKYTRKDASTRRIHLTDQKITHCRACALQCNLSSDCKAYQCSISLNHCYLFASRHVDSTLQVSDVSFCAKIPTRKCRSTSGVLQVGEDEDGCLCGKEEICYAGQNCYVAEGPVALGECVKPCPCAGPNPKVGFEICSTTNQTWISECHANCANAKKDYDGPCRPPDSKCKHNALIGSASQIEGPCECVSAGSTNVSEAVLCPVASTCFTDGTCGPPSCKDLAGNATSDHLVCASDGVTYPSACHIVSPDGDGNPVTVVSSGKCPLGSCTDGQSDCDNCPTSLNTGNSSCRSDLGTHCVTQCDREDLVANTCGCVPPCTSVTTLSSATDHCGCRTDAGYVVCDGYCYMTTDGAKLQAECLKGCPGSDPCLCHDQVCNEDEICDTKITPHQCVSMCQTPYDTDCICRDVPINKTKDILHCPGIQGNDTAMVCSTTINNSTAAECLPRCRTMIEELCVCGSLSSPVICVPDLKCSAEGDDGVCGQHCDNGETNCSCGDEFCLSDSASTSPTYCNAIASPPFCLPDCETDEWQKDCFCPNVNVWKTQNNPEMVCGNYTFCNATSSAPASEVATCKPGCEHVDGLVANVESCPCGVGEVCEAGEYCSHSTVAGELVAKCFKKVINETCLPNYEGYLDDACLCGGYLCPEGFFCDLSSGTCSPKQIIDCPHNLGSCVTDACFCGPSRMVCTPGDSCIAVNEHLACHSPIERCHSAPPLEGSTATKATNCLCGQDGEPCLGDDNKCESSKWSDTCHAVK